MSGKVGVALIFKLSVPMVLLVGMAIRLSWGMLIEVQPSNVTGNTSSLKPSGNPQLIATMQMPDSTGELGEWVPASARASLTFAGQVNPLPPSSVPTGEVRDTPVDVDRTPARIIHDSSPTFSAVGLWRHSPVARM